MTTDYDTWGLPCSLSGGSVYVLDASYDPLGRLDMMQSVEADVDLVYYPFSTQGGRLHEIRAGMSSPYTQTQHLVYTYDNVGNVTSITDHRNAGQVQSFQYDELDRLTRAEATGGADAYGPRDYVFNAVGNPLFFEGPSYQSRI